MQATRIHRLLVVLAVGMALVAPAPVRAAGSRAKVASQRKSGAVLRRPFRSGQPPLGDGPLLSSAAYDGFLDRPHYESIRDAALEILRRYPPNEYLYVGIGRAPTSLISFFKELNPGLAINFPASGLGSIGGHEPSAYQANYERHFAALIGGEAVRRKKILVLDRSYQGTSIHRLADSLRKWVATVNGKGVVGLGLFKGSGFYHAQNVHADVEEIDASRYPKLFLWGDGFAHDHDEDIGEYGGHYINAEPLDALEGKRNPFNATFRAQLVERMRRDEVLDRALTTELSRHLKK